MDNRFSAEVATRLSTLDLDRVFDFVREKISDPHLVEGYLKWPAVATLSAIMAEPGLLAAAAEVAFDGIGPSADRGQLSWLLGQSLFTASTAEAEYEIERDLALSPADRTHINPRAPEAIRDFVSRDERLAVMKFYVMADNELTRITMGWPAGPAGQYRIGDDGYVTDAQYERVIPDQTDRALYEYIANGGELTDEVIHTAVARDTPRMDDLASDMIERDPDAPVFYTDSDESEWAESLEEGVNERNDIRTERAHEVPGTKRLIAQISAKLGGGTEGALHTSSHSKPLRPAFGQA